MTNRATTLRQGLARLGCLLPEADQARLLAYLELLEKWNRAYALVSRRETGDPVVRHLLDSLAVLPYINGPRIVDVGTGAGLPGIPLAVARPDWRFTLLDSNGKKVRFITQAAIDLGIKNVDAVHARAEAVTPDGFDTVVSRAFASIADMVAVTAHLARPGGRLVAMKGVYPAQELEALPPGVTLEQVVRLEVPMLDAERHVVILRRE